MERYIKQLIEEFEDTITNRIIQQEIIKYKNEGESLLSFEQSTNGEEKEISEITGIETEKLPPFEKITEEQADLLANKMENLLDYFFFVLEFPEGVPGTIRYKLLRERWSCKVVTANVGLIHLEFCNYKQENCPFPEYCTFCSELNEGNTPKKHSYKSPNTPYKPSLKEKNAFLFYLKKTDIKNMLLKLTDREDIFHEIFNYCNLWCKRCSAQSCCPAYMIQKDLNFEFSDISKPLFWYNLKAMVFASTEICYEDPCMEMFGKLPNLILLKPHQEIKNQELISRVNDFSNKSIQWIDKRNEDIELKELKLATVDPQGHKSFVNAVEEIKWYQHLILNKFRHICFSSIYHIDFFNGQTNRFYSIKTVQQTIDLTLNAYSVLLELMPELNEEIQEQISELKTIKKMLDFTFPVARYHTREGIDEYTES